MTYIYLDKKLEKSKKYIISSDECSHIFSFKPLQGQKFYFTRFNGDLYDTTILNINKKSREIEILVNKTTHINKDDFYNNFDKPPFDILLAVPDKAYLDKFTELACFFPVKNIYLYFSNRSLEYKLNLERLEKILMRSSSQCHRLFLPKINIVKDYESVIKRYKNTYLFDTTEGSSVANTNNDNLYIIGPEGGWDISEVDSFKSIGVNIITKKGLIMPAWAGLLLI